MSHQSNSATLIMRSVIELAFNYKKNECFKCSTNPKERYSLMSTHPNRSNNYDNTHFQNHLAIPQYLNDHCALQRDATAFVNTSLQESVCDC